MDRYIIVEGNVVGGFAFHGGEQGYFETENEAFAYGDEYLSGLWSLVPLEPAL